MSKIKTLLTPPQLAKSLLTLSISLISMHVNAQSQNWWRVNGNTPSGSDFLGTTNNTSLIFKTNNITRFSIDGAGNLNFPSLTGTGIRFLTTDASGKMTATPSTSLLSVLSNNGVGVFQKVGNDYFIPTGNVGIGIAPSPGFKLDVIGDARISNNLFVGGGIVITDQVQAATQVKGWDFKVDNDLNVTGASSFTGTSNFKGNLIAGNGIELGNSFGIKSGITDSNGNNYLQVGKSFGGAILPAPPICPNAASNMAWLSNYGGYLSHATSGLMNASLAMWTDWINGNGHLEAQGTNNSGTANALLINYYCGRSVGINNGPNGGKIDLGGSATDFVTMFSPTKIRTYSGDALRIEDPNNNKTTFYVGTGGKTIIGEETQTTGPHTNALLTVNGKIVSKSCYIRISDWADYVFAKDYKVPNLYDIEKYYLANKHLPEIPSEKEVIENGIDLAEMNKLLLKKIEEMTIILVNQQKQIDQLNNKVK